ncbi:hypothetical protein RP20_CCG024871 [Aedes albopictus]|nr:hypothetical protein RP20_CCG024871 [Aedes albopictus]
MAASNSTSTRRTGLVPIATAAATAGHGFWSSTSSSSSSPSLFDHKLSVVLLVVR